MADLTITTAATTVRVMGANSSGVPTTPMAVTTSGAAQTTPPITGAGFVFGQLFTTNASAAAGELVLKNAYTEQTTNAQRSFTSSSANDTSAGTGARTLLLTYLDATGAGPFTETITMNGTANVNTVSSTICFVESITVVTTGSGLTNAGTITMKAAAAGGGATITTITAGDNKTLWTQHYVPLGKTCYLTDWHGANELNASTAGAITWLTATPLSSFERQITGKMRYIGNIGTLVMTFLTPLAVAGPARINARVVSESTSDNIHHAELCFFEV